MSQYEEDIAKCRLLIMDGNMELTTMEYILDVCRSAKVPGKTPNKFSVKLLFKNYSSLKRFSNKQRTEMRCGNETIDREIHGCNCCSPKY